jgi:hypothetical protein
MNLQARIPLSAVRNLQVSFTLISLFSIPSFPPFSLFTIIAFVLQSFLLCSFITPPQRRIVYSRTSPHSVYHPPNICTGAGAGTNPTQTMSHFLPEWYIAHYGWSAAVLQYAGAGLLNDVAHYA